MSSWGLILATLVLVCHAFPARAETPAKIRFLFSAIGGAQTIAWLTHEGGYFKKNGLDAELIYVSAGGKAVSAIIAGEAQAGIVAGQALVLARLAGSDVVSIASHTPTLVMSLMSQKDITAGSQLKGKTIAVTRIGSSTHMGLVFALKHFGLSEKDVQVIQIGGVPEIVAALQTGKIAAGMITPPNNFVAVKLGLRELLDVSRLQVPVDQGVLITTERFAGERPEQVRAIVKAYVEAIHRAKTDKAFTLKVLEKYTRIADPDMLEGTYASFIDRNMDRAPYPSPAAVKTVFDAIAPTVPKARGANPAEFVDRRWIEELDKSGFIKKLDR